MANVASRSVARQLESLFGGGSVAGLADRQLLERFTTRRDAAGEAAFAALVSRHGPTVLHVCRQLLGDRHHAEDAFQATFLVLARKARSIHVPDLLGNWLYGVALRTARKAKVRLARQHRHEEDGSMSGPGPGSDAPVDQPAMAREEAEALHDELDRLPSPFRLPIVLCYFEGMRSTTTSPWARFEPTPDDPWDLRNVAHLHRRAGFGATRAELLRDVAAGPEASVARLFHPPQLAAEDVEALDGLRQTARASSNLDLLKVGWLNRILHGPDALREKLALFWHGHFATSNKKVESVALMDQQNETLRTHALGSFAALLEAIIPDPAMLVWLDGGTSKKDQPNENFAREFLELFTLGAGHYSERDVREAARAFTGWVRQDPRGGLRETPTFALDPTQVAEGTITFLGKAGRWGPSDIVHMVLDRPEAATFLAKKLYRSFVSEAGAPGPDLIEPLAEEITRNKFAIGPIVEVILRSRHFYSRAAYRQRIKSPVEFSAGLVRMLELPRPALNPLALSAACDAQGQELFAPPNVEGWAGGPAWINSGTLLERTNWAADVIWGRAENGLAPFDPLAWAAHYKIAPGRAAEALMELLLQGDLGDEARQLALDAGRNGSPDGLRKSLQRLVNCPEFQLS